MLSKTLLVIASLGVTYAFEACYGGAACGPGHGCCDCNVTESECTGTWSASCTTAMCANDLVPRVSGCYVHPSGCDCSGTQATCAGSWISSCGGPNTGAQCWLRDLSVSPPSPPPAPPNPPPSPPQACIVQEGTEIPKTTAAMPDPVNEPCYSHASCKKYGDPTAGGYVCCVTRGTCDSGYVSASARYYEGGCMGVNYKYNASYISSTSDSESAPSVTEGCVKQGECNLPFLEQMRKWTATGGGLEHSRVPDATMTRLLVGSIENAPGACRAIYPFETVEDAEHKVTSTVTLDAALEDITDTVITAMETKVAAELGVNPANVVITKAAGSVVLTIEVQYATAAAATSGQATMTTAMADASSAATLLTTSAYTPTVTAVAAPVSGLTADSPPPPPPTTPPPSPESPPPPLPPPPAMGTAAIAGIAIGVTLVLIIVVVAIIMVMRKKKAPNTKPAGGAEGFDA